METQPLKGGLYSAYFFGNPAFMFEITRRTSEGMMMPYLIYLCNKLKY